MFRKWLMLALVPVVVTTLPARSAAQSFDQVTTWLNGSYVFLLDTNGDHEPDLTLHNIVITPTSSSAGTFTALLLRAEGTTDIPVTGRIAAAGTVSLNAPYTIEFSYTTGGAGPTRTTTRYSGAARFSTTGAGFFAGTFSSSGLRAAVTGLSPFCAAGRLTVG